MRRRHVALSLNNYSPNPDRKEVKIKKTKVMSEETVCVRATYLYHDSSEMLLSLWIGGS